MKRGNWSSMQTMKRMLLLFAAVTFAPVLMHGQGACEQLGVDCRHPNIQQRPAGAQEQKRNEDYWERREDARRERAAEKQRDKDREAQAKAVKDENQRIASANQLAAKAWASMQKEDCASAVASYDKALRLAKLLQWSKNRTVCLAKLRQYDAAYAQWETLINDRETPDAEVRGMRLEQWKIMYDKGYVCPVPPQFDGIEGCYRRPDRKTLDSTYVPLPIIDGKGWTAKNVISSGSFSVITKDGHVWKSGEANMTTVNLLDATIRTGKGSVVRFMLPDETSFVVGPNSDMTFDSFVYDPNVSHTGMAIRMAKGLFRFVTGVVARRDPATRNLTLAVGNLGFRGTDVEIEHDPNGAGTWNEGQDRWWISAYDGDISFVDGESKKTFPIPVGQHLLKYSHAAGYPIMASNEGRGIGVSPNYDDSPGAASLAIQKSSQLSVTDFWDASMKPYVRGRQ